MQQNQTNPQSAILSKRGQSVLATNKVLRNTYFLLSLTLLFSAIMAYVSMVTNAAPNTIVMFIVWIGLLFLTTALRNSVWGLVTVFAFTGVGGYILGPTLNLYLAAYVNGMQLIATALFGTGTIFLTLSAYVLITKKNFSYMGGFLLIGFTTAFILGLAAVFTSTPLLTLLSSGAFVLIMSGFILHDTSKIIHGGETNYILATISLYLNILILFQNLLVIISALSGNSRN